ncbi:MAG: hypothetical protein JNL41_10020 [Phenylobacterium sp.]|uniref:hypothetical protein n=1 Tax=Phenylobacterium sp. TaxID=1871053 RepID=UPI001A645C58|nr:hypothetical protein [Phenylobacterium sp.]MBL8554602.1 hypothetical protein [Phenylobacterium sp.]
MSKTATTRWAELVERYEDARRVHDAAHAAYAREAAGFDEGHELRCEATRDAEIALEDEMLAMDAPHLAAAAYQLKIFALRHCSVELDGELLEDEEPEGSILRRIHHAVATAAARH